LKANDASVKAGNPSRIAQILDMLGGARNAFHSLAMKCVFLSFVLEIP
jgi:hypothetical protein